MKRNRSYWIGFLSAFLVTGFFYHLFQAETIYGGDAGDLVSAIVNKGIAHPPGYPLYTILGILLNTFITKGTVAWRIGFVSSIFSLLAILLLFDLFVYLTKRVFFSLLSVLSLSFLYPLWLYSEVVEVFSLNNFFTVSLLWLFIHFSKERKNKYLYLGSFSLGLSLAHHHIIIFLFPALIYLLFNKSHLIRRRSINLSPPCGKKSRCVKFLRLISLFLLGLIPYLYVFISSSLNPAVNWQGPPTFTNFLHLVTRAGYGTFKAGSYIAHQPILRLLDVWAFLDFVYKDFRIFGILIFILGFIFFHKKDRTLWTAICIGIFSYLFFLFYASFPLVENFMVGTFERFIAPLYILISFFFPFGFLCLEFFFKKTISVVTRFHKRNISLKENGFIILTEKKEKLLKLAIIIFAIYPLGIFKLNAGKISILKNDFTAENLGRDILNSVSPESILILSNDTPLFNTQYVYYTEKKWPKVKLIHLTKLFTVYYMKTLEKQYPDLEFYNKEDASKKQFESFIENNYSRFAIYSKSSFSLANGVWIPQGLLFRFYRKEDIPDDKEILRINERLWQSYHDPLSGSLSRFINLILSDVLRVYSLARQEIGFWAAKRGFTLEAEKHLRVAEKLYPDDLDNFIILAQVYILEKKCLEASKQIETVLKRDPEDLNSYYLLAVNSAVCLKDEERASFYQRLFEEKSRGKETPLKKL